MNRTIILVSITAVMAGMVFAQENGKTGGPPGAVKSITLPKVTVELKAGTDKAKVDGFCSICHSLDYITMQPPFPKAQWTATVNKMIKTFGAPIPQEDAEKIINYLAVNYGTGS
jgi:hypothetical protein